MRLDDNDAGEHVSQKKNVGLGGKVLTMTGDRILQSRYHVSRMILTLTGGGMYERRKQFLAQDCFKNLLCRCSFPCFLNEYLDGVFLIGSGRLL